MKKIQLEWLLSHTKDLAFPFEDGITAEVPGEVQLDYARAKNYQPYYKGLNFKQFDWMEDEYFKYSSNVKVDIKNGEFAFLVFKAIDYRFDIKINNVTVYSGEGIFTPVRIDVTKYAGDMVSVDVIIYPIPKKEGVKRGRKEATISCKPASSYGWDWHPRLVPSGLIDEAYLETVPSGSPISLDVSYRMSDDLMTAFLKAEAEVVGEGGCKLTLTSPSGDTIKEIECQKLENGKAYFEFELDSPELWYPRGYGNQPIYTLTAVGNGNASRKLGFRRVKLVRNAEDKARFEKEFPKTSLPVPATLEVNGIKVFVKGSNVVNTEIFPSLATDKRYDELVGYAYEANLNLLRIWGGQYIKREYFYDLCDEKGILIWQEFMMSCNVYPDDDSFLDIMRQEAVSIVKRLRTHPSLAMWCAGNELFNSWSGLTMQAHPVRLLNEICFEYDRFTPFNLTSPMQGMVHGGYTKVEMDEDDSKIAKEFITTICESNATAYTEFGCNGGATPEYIHKYIMDDDDYFDCEGTNEVWREHHAFGALGKHRWLGKDEVIYYLNGWNDIDDLMEKTLYLQAMSYKSVFEEMRRQWPACSMAVNWDFNEPWPCAAGNSLLNWPAEPKPAFYAVRDALRPTLLSARIGKNRFLDGEMLKAEIWLLNDSGEKTEPFDATVSYAVNGEKTVLASVKIGSVEPRSNKMSGMVSFEVGADFPQTFKLTLESEKHPEYNSEYELVHKLSELPKN